MPPCLCCPELSRGIRSAKTAVSQLGDGAFADDPEVCSDLTAYTAVDSEKGIEQTLWADVITMAQWLAGDYTYFDGENPVEVAAGENAFGNFWIVDTDGWCYWAQPLEPQQATGLLLNSVEQTVKLFDSDANTSLTFGCKRLTRWISACSSARKTAAQGS